MADKNEGRGENESDAKKANKTPKKKWKWSDDMINDLIDALKNYKSVSEYNSIDFNADKVKLYEEVRKLMAVSHRESFGLAMATAPAKPTKDMSKSEYDHYKKNYDREMDEIKIGYKRVKEKIKSIRQDYSKAVTTGRRSGSGKVVLEFYDDLSMLWGGSPATEPLPFGLDSQSINNNKENNGIVVLYCITGTGFM